MHSNKYSRKISVFLISNIESLCSACYCGCVTVAILLGQPICGLRFLYPCNKRLSEYILTLLTPSTHSESTEAKWKTNIRQFLLNFLLVIVYKGYPTVALTLAFVTCLGLGLVFQDLPKSPFLLSLRALCVARKQSKISNNNKSLKIKQNGRLRTFPIT